MQFGHVRRPGAAEGEAFRLLDPVGPQERQVADLAVLDTFEQLAARGAMPAHQADADLEVLGPRFLGQLQHLTRARPVHRDRLLHEDVEALLDGVGEMHPAEGRRRGQDHHIARPETIHRFLVGVEVDELAVVGNVHLLAQRPLQVAVAVLQTIRENVGHGDELGRAVLALEGVLGGAGAAAAASDQSYLDSLAGACVDVWDGQAGQGRRHGELAGRSQHFAARRVAVGGITHDGFPP